MGRWDFYVDEAGEWRWRRFAANGEQVGASTEGYKNRADCEANAKREAANDVWTFDKDARGEWRWTRKARNGKIVGASSEGYKNKADCVENAKKFGYTGA